MDFETLSPNGLYCGFRLIRKQFVSAHSANLYTLRHEKTGAELLYFDRPDENKTFSICFKTLPSDDTGVFHILEHSVLAGSRKYPVKEPFVSMLQSSMQTFLNAMTFSDKTVYPVSSRNDQDFFNLMSVYLDAVFCPLIYDRPEIFMQEGWHFEFTDAQSEPYFNGVVYSEMKGAYADVDTLIEAGTNRLLYPDNSYGYESGGHPDHIPELTLSQFLDTHRRFYHPSNARIFLDGHMDIDSVLRFIDGEYLSKYEYRKPDFDFVPQSPKTAEHTVFYEPQESGDSRAHLVLAKILCSHQEVEKLYAARILADYLTGSNEAPLKRAFLERGLAQDVSLTVNDGVFQPSVSLVFRNTAGERFSDIRQFLPEAVTALLRDGLNAEDLSASLERLAFTSREITEPYGVDLAIKALDGWLYGDDPLTHIDNAAVFESLRARIDSPYFSDLLAELFADPAELSSLYVLPSASKGADDAKNEAARLAAMTADWDDESRADAFRRFSRMQQWQQSTDSEDVLRTIPRLNLKDIPRDIHPAKTTHTSVSGVDVLEVSTVSNGIAYLNLFFDISDFSPEELRLCTVLTNCFGELRTEHYAADRLQSRIKGTLGSLSARIELIAAPCDLTHCRPYLLVSAAMLEQKLPDAVSLLTELLAHSRYDETGRIHELALQNDYFLKQSLIGNGHTFAVARALSAFSCEGAMKEHLEGESYLRWFSDFTERFPDAADDYTARLHALAGRAFARNRLFIGFGGAPVPAELEKLICALPVNTVETASPLPLSDRNPCAIEIPSGVGYSAIGQNLYAAGSRFSGSCSVLSALMTYGYLWNMVRVQGGAYGTGMVVRANGDLICYSYRDPNLENTRSVYLGMADHLEAFLRQNPPLDDIVIGAVNTSDPLLDPAAVCELACIRHLKGITPQSLTQTRHELLDTTADDLAALAAVLRDCVADAKYCAVGDSASVSFIS